MAITISQQPTSPNMANNNLVFEVSSGLVSNAQYQYVCDVKDGTSHTLIQRIKQQPNPSGYGVFDVGMIVTSQLGPADKVWKTPVPQTQTYCAENIEVYFGEEWGTSVSSSVTLYNGVSSTPGNPAKTGSAYYYMVDGLVEPNSKINWNWASGSKYYNQFINDETFTRQVGLTDMPATQSARRTDYGTISMLNGNLHGAANSSDHAQDIYAMYVEQYDATGSLLIDTWYYNVSAGADNGGPRANSTQIWAQVYTSQSAATRLVHFPAFPGNIDDGAGLEADTAYYTLKFFEQATDGGANGLGIYGQYRINLVDDNCGYDATRFAWKNVYGVWDYFNFTLASSATAGIERSTFKQNFVNYSTTATTVTYDKGRRGVNNYINKIGVARTAESDWLTQEQADVVKELFFSADVYIQDGATFLPVVIANASVQEKTNPRTQKLFKYTVEYTLANDTQNRL